MTLSEFLQILHTGSESVFEIYQRGDDVDYIQRYNGSEITLAKFGGKIQKGECEIKQITVPWRNADAHIWLEGKFDPKEEGFKCFRGKPTKLYEGGTT